MFIPNGKQVHFNFTNDVTVVESISFESKKTMGKTTAIVENLKNKSSLVTGLPEGTMYKSFNVWVGNAGYGESDKIQNATVAFKVEKSWLDENNIDQSSVNLYKHDEDGKEWIELTPIVTGEDDNYLHFTAGTSGFSSFVIAGDTEGSALTSEPVEESVATEVRSAGNATATGILENYRLMDSILEIINKFLGR